MVMTLRAMATSTAVSGVTRERRTMHCATPKTTHTAEVKAIPAARLRNRSERRTVQRIMP